MRSYEERVEIYLQRDKWQSRAKATIADKKKKAIQKYTFWCSTPFIFVAAVMAIPSVVLLIPSALVASLIYLVHWVVKKAVDQVYNPYLFRIDALCDVWKKRIAELVKTKKQ